MGMSHVIRMIKRGYEFTVGKSLGGRCVVVVIVYLSTEFTASRRVFFAEKS